MHFHHDSCSQPQLSGTHCLRKLLTICENPTFTFTFVLSGHTKKRPDAAWKHPAVLKHPDASFDNMQVLIFLWVRLENAYSCLENWFFWEQNREGVVQCWPPQQTGSYFWVFLSLCHFRWKPIKKCDCESAHRQMDTCIDRDKLDL